MGWITKNGKPVYIPDKRGGLVVTIGIAVTVAVGGAAGAIGTGSEAAGGASGVSADSNVTVSVRSARTSREKSDRVRVRLRLHHRDTRATGDDTTTDCAALTTGRVREYLAAHACRSLQRGSFQVRPDGRHGVVVEVAWIEMPNSGSAAQLKVLLDAPGSGHVRPLNRRVDLTGQNYWSNRDGEVVTTAEAEPLTGRIEKTLLRAVARDAAG